MATRVHSGPDGTHYEFDRGRFDEWCVWVISPSGQRNAPRDVEYFAELLEYATEFSESKVYADFVTVYEATKNEVSDDSIRLVEEISKTYGNHSRSAFHTFLVLHMAMIAENLKKNTRLGKRIKRLGVHELFASKSVTHSASFMRGMGWRQIDEACRSLGF